MAKCYWCGRKARDGRNAARLLGRFLMLGESQLARKGVHLEFLSGGCLAYSQIIRETLPSLTRPESWFPRDTRSLDSQQVESSCETILVHDGSQRERPKLFNSSCPVQEYNRTLPRLFGFRNKLIVAQSPNSRTRAKGGRSWRIASSGLGSKMTIHCDGAGRLHQPLDLALPRFVPANRHFRPENLAAKGGNSHRKCRSRANRNVYSPG
jgi:hypothetical protein